MTTVDHVGVADPSAAHSSPVGRDGDAGPLRRGRRVRTAVPALVMAFFGLFVLGYVFANPPGYTPDEPSHYIKALGIAQGQWDGLPGQYQHGMGFTGAQLTWINKTARTV